MGNINVMIKLGFKIYAFIAILAPWIFLLARLSGVYNYPTRNTLIFLGLFIYSGITMFLTFRTWSD